VTLFLRNLWNRLLEVWTRQPMRYMSARWVGDQQRGGRS